jgi:hypothetical protein
MKVIDLSTHENTVQETFDEGHSIQVRVVVSENDANEYEKGKMVKIRYKGTETMAKIVSEPLEVTPEAQRGEKTLSLIVEKP